MVPGGSGLVPGGIGAVAFSAAKVPVPGGWGVAIAAVLHSVCPDAINYIASLGMATA